MFLGPPIRWSQGFQLGGPAKGRLPAGPMGRLSSPETFGHNGSTCCIAWAHPGRQLAFVYLTDRLTVGHDRHQGEVADAIIAACT